MLFILSMAIFLVLNYFDGFSTYLFVKKHGYQREWNPIARIMICRFGIISGLLLLKSVIIIILPLMVWVYHESGVSMLMVLLGLNALYMWVVLHNVDLI
jgi:hypothetical protein